MAEKSWSPTVVPFGADETVYLVVDRFLAGRDIYREAEFERTDLETIIADLMSGQFNDPVRVIAFNTLEHWARDISAEVATEIQTRCDIDGEPLPEHVGDFVTRHAASHPTACPVGCRSRPTVVSPLDTAAVVARREAEAVLERPREMGLIVEAPGKGDFGDLPMGE